jgi:hypothetical protein
MIARYGPRMEQLLNNNTKPETTSREMLFERQFEATFIALSDTWLALSERDAPSQPRAPASV